MSLPEVQDNRPRDTWCAIQVVAIAAAVLLFELRYNLQLRTVWDMSPAGYLRTWEEFLLVNIGTLLLPMFAWLFLIRREPAEQFGLSPINQDGWRFSGIATAAMLPILWIASRYPAFYTYYPMQPVAHGNLGYLVYYELTYTFYLLAWEMFFRGFITFGLARGLQPVPAILVQAAAFACLHIGKPAPEIVGSFFGGAALGWIALRTRSFVPCWLIHAGVSTLFDLFCIQARPGGLF